MKHDFLIIGASGMQGRIVTRDLLESGYKVMCADLYRDGSEKNLAAFPDTEFTRIDLRDLENAKKVIHDAEAKVVINCAEGDWNDVVYKICLEEKCHVIDLGSDIPTTKDQIALSEQFKNAGLTALTGCGSTPGVNNVMLAYLADDYSDIDTVEAGFAWDSNIKKFVVPFSMPSIMEELLDPAQVLEHGVWGEKNPLDTESVREFREIGAQKCYLVRHPETWTFAEFCKDKGVKNIRFYAGFPDHTLEVLNKVIELGMDGEEALPYEKSEILPITALSRILTRLPRPEGYTEKENLWVEVSGHDKQGGIKLGRMECIVATLPGWEDAGCNIDTGLPASIMAQMVLDGRVEKRGSFAPEDVVPAMEFFKELKKRGMTVYKDGVAVL
jgi:lysine 6-dehydrogenase